MQNLKNLIQLLTVVVLSGNTGYTIPTPTTQLAQVQNQSTNAKGSSEPKIPGKLQLPQDFVNRMGQNIMGMANNKQFYNNVRTTQPNSVNNNKLVQTQNQMNNVKRSSVQTTPRKIQLSQDFVNRMGQSIMSRANNKQLSNPVGTTQVNSVNNNRLVPVQNQMNNVKRSSVQTTPGKLQLPQDFVNRMGQNIMSMSNNKQLSNQVGTAQVNSVNNNKLVPVQNQMNNVKRSSVQTTPGKLQLPQDFVNRMGQNIMSRANNKQVSNQVGTVQVNSVNNNAVKPIQYNQVNNSNVQGQENNYVNTLLSNNPTNLNNTTTSNNNNEKTTNNKKKRKKPSRPTFGLNTEGVTLQAQPNNMQIINNSSQIQNNNINLNTGLQVPNNNTQVTSNSHVQINNTNQTQNNIAQVQATLPGQNTNVNSNIYAQARNNPINTNNIIPVQNNSQEVFKKQNAIRDSNEMLQITQQFNTKIHNKPSGSVKLRRSNQVKENEHEGIQIAGNINDSQSTQNRNNLNIATVNQNQGLRRSNRIKGASREYSNVLNAIAAGLTNLNQIKTNLDNTSSEIQNNPNKTPDSIDGIVLDMLLQSYIELSEEVNTIIAKLKKCSNSSLNKSSITSDNIVEFLQLCHTLEIDISSRATEIMKENLIQPMLRQYDAIYHNTKIDINGKISSGPNLHDELQKYAENLDICQSNLLRYCNMIQSSLNELFNQLEIDPLSKFSAIIEPTNNYISRKIDAIIRVITQYCPNDKQINLITKELMKSKNQACVKLATAMIKRLESYPNHKESINKIFNAYHKTILECCGISLALLSRNLAKYTTQNSENKVINRFLVGILLNIISNNTKIIQSVLDMFDKSYTNVYKENTVKVK